jgi:hypothetical protein
MLPQMQRQEERRPKVGSPGSPSLVIPPKPDEVTLTYDQYVDKMPSEEDLEPYAEPVIYWNPIDPGAYIKPWPQLGMMHDQNGKIICWNKAEEDAWRNKLAQYAGGNPDKWKGNTGDYAFECETCHFITFNAIAWTDHVRYWKHK